VNRRQPFDVAGVARFQYKAISLEIKRYLVTVVADQLDEHPKVVGDRVRRSALIGESA
jgi:hypothetical protein